MSVRPQLLQFCFGPSLLSISIYNTENCWINSLTVPDISFEPRMSYCWHFYSHSRCLLVHQCLSVLWDLFALQWRSTDGWHWGKESLQASSLHFLIPWLSHTLYMNDCPEIYTLHVRLWPFFFSSILCFKTSSACFFTELLISSRRHWLISHKWLQLHPQHFVSVVTVSLPLSLCLFLCTIKLSSSSLIPLSSVIFFFLYDSLPLQDSTFNKPC